MSFNRRTRRDFISASTALFSATPAARADESAKGELLYNGIRLPKQWPPQAQTLSREPMAVPYLAERPQVVPIDVGRQLFFDDFLIERMDLTRRFHTPEIHSASPVLRPDAKYPWEKTKELGTAMTFSDGVWYDAKSKRFRMWYMGGFQPGATCLAESTDGVHWNRPVLDVKPGTNVVEGTNRDSSTVWMDLAERDPAKRFKMSMVPIETAPYRMRLQFSPDGIHWTGVVATTGTCGDRSTFFYNPFRKVWVYSLRGTANKLRVRRYWENTDLLRGAAWEPHQPTYWVGADKLDAGDPAEPGTEAQLYTLDAVAYESVLLGLFSVMRGRKRKGNELVIGFSRDGFHWDRPDRRPFVATSPREGDWNHDYLHSAGGCCLIVGDKLHFYVGGRSGDFRKPDSYRSVGLVTLRRDGFASLDAGSAGGTVTTRPVRFSGKNLFVNASAGELRAEVLDESGKPVEPYTLTECVPFTGDRTVVEIRWKRGKNLANLVGKTVRLRFSLKNGSLYSFWVSPGANGASRGYTAAGGPGLSGLVDTNGSGS
ncbi:MAG: hypothetical protein FJW38_29120 [Acidobacteria bacterium]|nr:hypothetical protein [Acidobacteriota bacterium]